MQEIVTSYGSAALPGSDKVWAYACRTFDGVHVQELGDDEDTGPELVQGIEGELSAEEDLKRRIEELTRSAHEAAKVQWLTPHVLHRAALMCIACDLFGGSGLDVPPWLVSLLRHVSSSRR